MNPVLLQSIIINKMYQKRKKNKLTMTSYELLRESEPPKLWYQKRSEN